jgi:hypothetical protein
VAIESQQTILDQEQFDGQGLVELKMASSAAHTSLGGLVGLPSQFLFGGF